MKKYNIKYYQIDLSNIDKELETLNNYQDKGYMLMGVEITHHSIIEALHISLDPQHDNVSKSNITSIENAFTNRQNIIELIQPFNDVLMIFQKPDIDSIGTGSFLTLAINGRFEIFGDILLRLKAIANSDRHGRKDWNTLDKDLFNCQGFSSQGIPISLFTYIGDISIGIDKKINAMTEYLEQGTFTDEGEYEIKALKKLQNSHNSTKVDIILRNKLVFVESTYRGAIGLGYTYAPVVIARNELYSFDNNIGTKVTIAQYNDNFIDLTNTMIQLNKLESGWGGSSTIIGSRQTGTCNLDLARIKKIVLSNMRN